MLRVLEGFHTSRIIFPFLLLGKVKMGLSCMCKTIFLKTRCF